MSLTGNSHPNNSVDRSQLPPSPHHFHIPVMGTGFTVDTPLRVAKYGISSVLSIGDDILIERMRELHCKRNNLAYVPISRSEEDARARRITAYLNMIDELVAAQVAELRTLPFEPGTDITRYFEMLPDSPLKRTYLEMLASSDTEEKTRLQDQLRQSVVAGSIDVNIMTKLDRDEYKNGVKQAPEYAVAMSALRGFANSTLRSSIVLSAGLNRRLYAYIAKFEDFLPDENGELKKKIVLKVSDHRSALAQGKMLAKKGVWVSEYRVESGLNCGGHAFATVGHLMGPILEEFSRKGSELTGQLFELYRESVRELGRVVVDQPPEVRLTVQGGICTFEEDRFLREYYKVDSTGWGTPFLLVPEVTNIDDVHLTKLKEATEAEVELSDKSPVGIPFWILRTSASEETRLARIRAGRPGSPCPQGFLGFDNEFSEVPICRASELYQRLKIEQILENGSSPEQSQAAKEAVLAKTCICVDLAGGAMHKNNLPTEAQTAVCCGPTIAFFSEIATLEDMIDHIYGRKNLLKGAHPSSLFIREIGLYIDYLHDLVAATAQNRLDRTTKYLLEFKTNLAGGIDYYRQLVGQLEQEKREAFLKDLDRLGQELHQLFVDSAISATT